VNKSVGEWLGNRQRMAVHHPIDCPGRGGRYWALARIPLTLPFGIEIKKKDIEYKALLNPTTPLHRKLHQRYDISPAGVTFVEAER